MAAPTFVAASTGSQDTAGDWAFTCAAPGASGRLILVHILQDGTGTSVTGDMAGTNINAIDGTANTWTRLKSSAPAIFGIGSPQSAFHNIWAGRSTSTSAPTISGSNAAGDDLYFRAYEFQDASTGTTLATVFENGTIDMNTTGSGLQTQDTSGTVSHVDVVTNGSDRLAACFIGINDDNSLSAMTGETGGDWSLAVSTFASATGTDASLTLMIAAMASAGTLSGGTTTNPDAADGWGSVAFAIIGTTVAGKSPPFRPRRRCTHCR